LISLIKINSNPFDPINTNLGKAITETDSTVKPSRIQICPLIIKMLVTGKKQKIHSAYLEKQDQFEIQR
jgi:hypothetical protein